MTSPITTHVLDTATGQPAAGVAVTLDRQTSPGEWTREGQGATDADGRLRTLLAPGALRPGAYRVSFDAGAYFAARGVEAFWRTVVVEFVVGDVGRHYHVPLLVSPFGYSTYRGS
ncbi:MAG TPA: hydroxyisourate hydrolase [Polyangiaceae bacterium]|jgi:5-hydroxyisourate hydrolase